MSWVDDLDACSAAGVINFDAPSFIRGSQPRYVGNPDLENISNQVPNMKPQPQKDEFKKADAHNNPSWKKWAFGIFAGTMTVFAGYKMRNTKLIKNLIGNIKNLPNKIKHIFKKPKAMPPATP